MNKLKPIALIPAYKPEPAIVEITSDLIRSGQFQKVVVINDGSGPEYGAIFKALEDTVDVEILRHHVNLGKGAALKTGFNYIACQFPNAVGVVTLDADGQHLVPDILKVAAKLIDEPHKLILGSREFQRDVPLRSRFGNLMTRRVLRLLVGLTMRDTQTGLRGIPMAFIAPCLRLKTLGYDFELDMLLKAKEKTIAIEEVAIQTVYNDENKSSHFNPLLDSMRIYFVFIRFFSVSIIAALIDNSVFAIAYSLYPNILGAQILGRVFSILFHYTANKKAVFKSEERNSNTFSKYILFIIIFGILGYCLINLLVLKLCFTPIPAKLLAEGLLFFMGFFISKDIIFKKGS